MEELIDKLYKYVKEYKYKYGTAGFRFNAYTIENKIAPRIGSLLLIITNMLNWGKVGLVVTASHNSVIDNGIKIINNRGEMVEKEIERLSEIIINLPIEIYNNIIKSVSSSYKSNSYLIIGTDNRPNSRIIKDIIIDDWLNVNRNIIDLDICTTPNLHFIVVNPLLNYLNYIYDNFMKLNKYIISDNRITIDCANGAITNTILSLSNRLYPYIMFDLININDGKYINDGCGAEYVHKTKKIPKMTNLINNKVIASFDGDADRLIMIYKENDIINIIDGDQIGTIITDFIIEQINIINIETNIGYIQTAYANGNSTKYIRNQKIETKYVATGVKYLHNEAKKYDIGIYFESNGHGTVLFKKEYINKIKEIKDNGKQDAINNIIYISQLMNQTVGDALSILLVIISIMNIKNTTLNKLVKYDNKPNNIYKMIINNKDSIKTNEDETRIIEPKEIQDKIDKLINEFTEFNPRIFIRPSGTEDCIRIYIESDLEDINYIIYNNLIDNLFKK